MGLSRSERVVLCLLSAAILVGRIVRDRADRTGEILLLGSGPADTASTADSARATPPDSGARRAAEEGAKRDTVAAEQTVTWPLDLNAATETDLMLLPGIGPAKARAILDRRAQKGPYTSVEELLDVSGIGPKTLARFRDLVVVAAPSGKSESKNIGGRP